MPSILLVQSNDLSQCKCNKIKNKIKNCLLHLYDFYFCPCKMLRFLSGWISSLQRTYCNIEVILFKGEAIESRIIVMAKVCAFR